MTEQVFNSVGVALKKKYVGINNKKPNGKPQNDTANYDVFRYRETIVENKRRKTRRGQQRQSGE